jgi:hypothetical protein
MLSQLLVYLSVLFRLTGGVRAISGPNQTKEVMLTCQQWMILGCFPYWDPVFSGTMVLPKCSLARCLCPVGWERHNIPLADLWHSPQKSALGDHPGCTHCTLMVESLEPATSDSPGGLSLQVRQHRDLPTLRHNCFPAYTWQKFLQCLCGGPGSLGLAL